MTQSEAEKHVVREWQKLPLENRQTEDQAAAFAMEYAYRLEFPCKGDKYQALMASIKRFLLQTQGKI